MTTKKTDTVHVDEYGQHYAECNQCESKYEISQDLALDLIARRKTWLCADCGLEELAKEQPKGLCWDCQSRQVEWRHVDERGRSSYYCSFCTAKYFVENQNLVSFEPFCQDDESDIDREPDDSLDF